MTDKMSLNFICVHETYLDGSRGHLSGCPWGFRPFQGHFEEAVTFKRSGLGRMTKHIWNLYGHFWEPFLNKFTWAYWILCYYLSRTLVMLNVISVFWTHQFSNMLSLISMISILKTFIRKNVWWHLGIFVNFVFQSDRFWFVYGTH